MSFCCGLAAWALAGGTGWAQPVVSSTMPVKNVHNALATSNVDAIFSVAMSAATASTFVVHGSMSAKMAGAYLGGGTTTISFDPTNNFKPGEEIEVIFTGGATSGYTSTTNSPIASGGYVFRFRAAAGTGPTDFTGRRHIGPGTGGQTLALAAADVDNDGDIDLATGDDGGQNVLYKQVKGEFSIASNFGTGAENTTDIALGDVNGDGFIDAALAGSSGNSTMHANDGSGNFTGTPFPIASGDVENIALGDINGDGSLDYVLGFNNFPKEIRFNDGSGGVANSQGFSVGGTNTNDIAVADVDGDGDLDVAVVNGGTDPDQFFLNDGLGNMTAGDTFALGSNNGRAVALGDIDGDGDIDEGVAAQNNQNAFEFNNGAGTYSGFNNIGSGSDNSRDLALGDVDGDGDLDVAVVNQQEQNALYKNDGAGNFTAGTVNFGPAGGAHDYPRKVVMADLNGDGFLDIAVANTSGSPNYIYYNDAPPSFASSAPPANARNAAVNSNVTATFSKGMTGPTTPNFKVFGSMSGKLNGVYGGTGTSTLFFNPGADFKRGEEIHVVFTAGFTSVKHVESATFVPLDKSRIYQFRAGTAAGPGDWASVFSSYASSATHGVEVGDVDGDGDVDVVAANANSINQAFLNDGSGALTASTSFDFGGDNTLTVDLGDINGDGDLDVVTGAFGAQSVVRENNGSGVFGAPINFGGASDNTRPAVFGDADADGGLDIAQGVDGGQNRVHFNNGASGFPSSLNFGTGSDNTKHLDWGDADADGDLDLYVGNFSEANRVYLNDGFGNFTAGNTFGSGSDQTHWLDVGDLDGDGDADAVMANMSGEQNAIAFNDGAGNFTNGAAFGLTAIARSVVLGDADGDADLDAAVTYDVGGQNAIYLNNGAGLFSGGPFNFGDPNGQTMIAAWADMNADGDLDLVAGNNNTVSAIHYNATAPTLSGLLPGNNENDGTRTGNLSTTFSQSMSGGTFSNFVVYSSTKGRRTGTYSGNGSPALAFDPAVDFVPNEMVQTTFTGGFSKGITNTNSDALAKPFVWRYRTQAGVGPAAFADYAIPYGSPGGNSSALEVADIDNDGDVDLGVGNIGQNVIYKNATGNFSDAVNFGSGIDNTVALAFGDLDRDGDPDVVVGNNSGGFDGIYLNDGAGNFSAWNTTFGGTLTTDGLAIGDIDGDGSLDIAVAHSATIASTVYFNDGAANFNKNRSVGPNSDQSMAVALGDIDNDGDLDVALARNMQQDLAYINEGAGVFSTGTKNFGGASDAGRAVELGDLDNNGSLDVAVGNEGGQNAAYLNDGSGNFTAGTRAFGSGSDNTVGIALGDVDGDGDIDVAAANSAEQNAVYKNDGTGNLSVTVNFGTGSDNTDDVVLIDLMQDLDLDIAVVNAGQPNTVHLNEVAPTLNTTTPPGGAKNVLVGNDIIAMFSEAMSRLGAVPFRAVGAQTGNKAGAFSGDNTATLTFNPSVDFKAGEVIEAVFTTAFTGGGVVSQAKKLPLAKPYVWRFTAAAGPGSANFASGKPFGPGTDASVALALADVDGDGDIDAGVGNNAGGQNIAYLNNGSGNFSAGTKTFGSGSDNSEAVFFADVDGDGDLDAGVGNNGGGQNIAYLNNGAGDFNAGTRNIGVGDDTRAMAVGDLDGDGDPDVAVGNATAQQNIAFMNDGAANFNFETNNFGSGGDNTLALALGDPDKDGDLDIAVGNALQQSAVYLNDGKGGFSTSGTNFGSAGDDVRGLFFVDVEADGDLDLATAKGGTQQNVVYLNDGAGNFSAGTKNFGPGADNSTGTDFADVDGDGDLDAIAVNGGGQNAAYLNDGGGNFTVATRPFGTGSDNSAAVATGDVDNDGDLDVAAVNASGQNAAYLNEVVPTLSTTTPAGGAKHVGVGNDIVAVFSEAMSRRGPVPFRAVGAQTGNRAGAFSGDNTATLTFNPSVDFKAGESIEAVFTASSTGGVVSTANKVSLGKPYVWRFTAAAAAGPALFADLSRPFGPGTDASVALALADIDGDGDLDAGVGNNAGGQNIAYLNNGSGNFSAGTKTFGSGSDNSEAVFFADVDGDGDLDAGVGNNGGGQNIAYLNNGAGTFNGGPKNIGFGDDTRAMAVGDLDGDGDPDVAVGNATAQQNVAYLNDGAANFNTGSKTFGSGGDNTLALALGDPDKDGDLDIAVGNALQQSAVYLNDGAGNFSAGTKNFGTAGDDVRGLFFVDVEADGDLDIATAKGGTQQNVVYLNDGAGNFSAGTKNFGPGSDNSTGTDFADVDGDGDLDAIAVNGGGQNAAYLNDGGGNFTVATRPFGTGSDNSAAVATGDVDNDGDLDIAAVNASQVNAVYLNEVAPTLSTTTPAGGAKHVGVGNDIVAVFSEAMSRRGPVPFRAVGAQTGNRAGVFTGDNTATLTFNPSVDFKAGEVIEAVFTTGPTGGGIVSTAKKAPLSKPYVWRFTAAAAAGPGLFTGLGRPLGPGTDASVALALADIDGDGDLDAGVGNNAGGQNTAYLNDGAGNFTAGIKNFGSGSDNSEAVFFADVDGDGDLDAGVGNNGGGQNIAYLNNGAGDFNAGTRNIGVGDDTRAMAVGDLDGDGDPDVAVGNATAQQNVAYLNDGAANFNTGSKTFGSGGDNTLALALGDPDKDGDLDIAVGNALQQSAVYLNDGAGNFSAGTKNFGTTGDDVRGLFFVDVEADGDLDMAAAKGGTQQNVVYLNDGAGNFSAGTKNFGPGSDNSTGAAFADVDGDGDLDAIAVNSGGQNAAYLNDGGGNFTVATRPFGTGSDNAAAVATGDVDNDGDLDIAAANAGGQNLIFLNVNPPTLTSTAPPPHLLAAAKGTNISAVFSEAMTAPTAASFRAFSGYAGNRAGVRSLVGTTTLSLDPAVDFAPGEAVEVVFSASATDGTRNKAGIPLARGHVLRFRVQAGVGPGAFPSLGVGFGSGADNTRALALGDFNADGKLDVAAGNSAGQDEVTLNQGIGVAAIVNGFGSGADATTALAAGDVDGDGDLDVAAGREGGQNAFYLNDGSGNLGTARNFGSGGDATLALAVGDADGDGDLDVAAGNGSTQQNAVYLNDGAGNFSAGRNVGAPDNATAVRFADVDRDGDLDVAVGKDGAQNAVYLNDGLGNFGAGVKNFGSGSAATRAVSMADVNGDGHLDAASGNAGAQNAVYLNDGTGNFNAGVKNFGSGSDATSSLDVGDVDGDGDLDVGVGNDGAQNAVYLNDGSGDLGTARNFGSGSDATKALVFGDADVDGDMDIAVGNNPSQNAIYINSAFAELGASRGLVGISPALLGGQRQVLRVGVRGDGVVGVEKMALTVGDLGAATGLAAADFDSLSVYASADTVFDAADSLVATTTAVNIGTETVINFGATATVAKDVLRYFIAVAAIDAGATIGHSFKVGFAKGALGTSIGGMGAAIAASDSARAIITPDMKETTPAFGLLGIAKALPGTEVKLLGIGMTGDGVQTVDGIALTLSDLTTATGIDTSNIDSLNFYVSSDSVLSTGTDSLVAVAPRDSLAFGSPINLAPATPHAPPIAQERFYLVSVVVDSTAFDNRSFKAGFAAGGLATSKGALGTAVAAADSNRVAIDVKATKLVLIRAPADAARIDTADAVVSGKPFATQPIVEAQDASGNVDLDFAETIVAALTSGAGALSGGANKIPVAGRADFSSSGLAYNAQADGEAFTLTFDDEPGGADLTAVATAGLSADAVATRLVFSKQPAPLLDPGLNFAPDSVAVTAVDPNGLADREFGKIIRIQAVSANDINSVVDSLTAAPADSVAADSGTAVWTDLRLPTADLIKLKATSDSLLSGLSNIVAIPGGLAVGGADTLVARNPLAGLAGKGGTRLVLNALALRASGERMALNSVNVKPVYQGVSGSELRNLDLILDLDANGRVDAADASVLAAAVDDGGSGVELTLSVTDTLPADTLRHYLVVADLDSTVRATDQLQIDVTNIAVGSGLATGVVPAVPVRSVPGRNHVVTGQVAVVSVALENAEIGQSGKLTVVFDTASDLAAGDELVFDFPPGFDIAQTAVDPASLTPSGALPTRSAASGGRTVVLELAAAEPRGRYQIGLLRVKNPTSNQGAGGLVVLTRLADDTPVDTSDPAPPGLELSGSGQLDLQAVSLRGYAGGSGSLRLALRTASALAVGDGIAIKLPAGFDLSQVALGDSTATPSGTPPQLTAVDSAGASLVLAAQASEAAGDFLLILRGIGFPPTAAKDLGVVVQTRRADGAALDLADGAPPLVALPGRLALSAGAEIPNVLGGIAGTAAGRLALTSFRLRAGGEGISVLAVELLPLLTGIQGGDLSAVDILLDENGDGVADAGDRSVAVQTLSGLTHGTPAAIGLSAQQLDRDATRSYLVVADIGAGIGSTDRLRIDIAGATADVGSLSGVAPVVSGAPLAGPVHTASGFIALDSVELETQQAGASGQIALVFTTASALAAGDLIALAFPPGFDLGAAALAAGSQAPSGAALARDNAASTRGTLALQLTAAEAAGTFAVTLDGVVNPALAASDLTVAVTSRKADGTLVDGSDPEPVLFEITRSLLALTCQADFDGDGRVYFSDLFRFGDAFGSAGASGFDLDGDLAVGFSDFFVFTEVFGARCDTTGGDPGGETGLALQLRDEILGTTLDFALVRAGRFTMGSPADESGREADEGPQRRVALSQSFYLGQFEVTQAQWQAVMGTTPWAGLPAVVAAADHPAVYISWSDAQAFVQALNAAAGDSLYRLPWEAEWEYAARAGTSTRWSFGDEEGDLSAFAWTRRVPAVVSELVTHPVGSKRPNAWELYDMHGSAAEWVGDYYGAYEGASATDPVGPGSGSARVLRGGGLTLAAADTRSAARDAFDPTVRLSTFGFRVLRRIPTP